MTEIFNLSLQDFLLILKKSWISILIIGLIGFACAFAYLQFIPNVYIASAQVQLSQIRGADYEWSNLEDPNLLIARMKSPAGFSDKSQAVCQYSSRLDMVKSIQFSLIKASPPTVEIGVKNLSPELSLKCTVAVVEDLRNYEADLVGKKIIQNKEWLQYYLGRMNKLKLEYPQLPTSQSTVAPVDQIASRDQVSWLTNKIMSLDSIIRFADEGAGRLLSPIYASPIPISQKSLIIEIAGLLLGLLIGLFTSICRYAYFPRLNAFYRKNEI